MIGRIVLKVLGLHGRRLNPNRVGRSILPFTIIIGLAVAGAGIAFSWSFSMSGKTSWGLTNAILLTVVWAVLGFAIALGIPVGFWSVAHRLNDWLDHVEGVKRVQAAKPDQAPKDPPPGRDA